jgi:glycosyltransferase involved in cell wall biosynthesis
MTAAEVTLFHAPPRTLAGATVLQMVTALREAQKARAALNVARALVQVGARAIIAGERGELVDELESFGGEWLPFAAAAFGPQQRRIDVDTLSKLVAAERVDIVHARTLGAARIARIVADRNGPRLVTELPDLSAGRMRFAAFSFAALARGDRMISHSLSNARPMMARHRIAPERIGVIAPSLDLSHFDPASVPQERVTQLRQAWGIPHGTRVALVPGEVAPRNGHLTLIGAARILSGAAAPNVTFVLVGDDRRRRFIRKFWRRARAAGVDSLFRMVGHRDSLVAAYAAADMVVVPYTTAPPDGYVVAQVQAMARPVIASSVGALPENLLAPPRIAEALRTGWEVSPSDTAELARAIATILALDGDGQRALAARARQFAEYTFSTQRATAATLEIYASLLDGDD